MRRLRRSNSSDRAQATVDGVRQRRLDFLARPQSLLGERDAAGLREGAEVRCGIPTWWPPVADALELEHKYRSVVIVSAPENRLVDARRSKRCPTRSRRRRGWSWSRDRHDRSRVVHWQERRWERRAATGSNKRCEKEFAS